MCRGLYEVNLHFSWDWGSYGKRVYVSTFYRTACFPELLSCLTFLPAVNERSSCSVTSPWLGIVAAFYFSHSDECEVVSRGGFNLHFAATNGDEHVFMCLPAIHAP